MQTAARRPTCIVAGGDGAGDGYRLSMADKALRAADDNAETATEAAPEIARLTPVEGGAADLVAGWGSAYSSVVRLAAGVVGVIADRAQEAANAAPVGDPEDSPSVVERVPQQHVPGEVVFGFAADLPDRFERMATSVGVNTGVVRGVVDYGWRLTAGSPIGWLISKPVDAVLGLVDAESDRLTQIGRAEVSHGKVLVEGLVDTTIDGVLDNVAESDALEEMIRDQAFGITDSAIQEVRETGAAADNLTDSAIRRILRRSPRGLPPRPAEVDE